MVKDLGSDFATTSETESDICCRTEHEIVLLSSVLLLSTAGWLSGGENEH